MSYKYHIYTADSKGRKYKGKHYATNSSAELDKLWRELSKAGLSPIYHQVKIPAKEAV